MSRRRTVIGPIVGRAGTQVGYPRSHASLHRGVYTDQRVELHSEAFDTPVEFDELVIDDWLHLEQMSARAWWMSVGNGDDQWTINVHVDAAGRATVAVEQNP